MNDPLLPPTAQSETPNSDEKFSKNPTLNFKTEIKDRITIHTCLGIGIMIMFFMAASGVSNAGKNISMIESVGGKTLEEAYYTQVGNIYQSCAIAIRALGIFALIVTSNQGGRYRNH